MHVKKAFLALRCRRCIFFTLLGGHVFSNASHSNVVIYVNRVFIACKKKRF